MIVTFVVNEKVSPKQAHQLALEAKQKLTNRQQGVKGEGIVKGEELIRMLKIKSIEGYLQVDDKSDNQVHEDSRYVKCNML